MIAIGESGWALVRFTTVTVKFAIGGAGGGGGGGGIDTPPLSQADKTAATVATTTNRHRFLIWIFMLRPPIEQ